MYKVLAGLPIMAAAAAEGGADELYKGVITEVSNVLSTASATDVLKYAVGVCIGLVFMWWAVRKVSGMLMRAFKRGKLRL